MKRVIVAAAFLSAAWSHTALAVEILKSEPPSGPGSTLRAPVYVESAKCGKGQVMMVSPGVLYGGRNAAGGGTARKRECVARPS